MTGKKLSRLAALLAAFLPAALLHADEPENAKIAAENFSPAAIVAIPRPAFKARADVPIALERRFRDDCSVSNAVGTTCSAAILSLRPTQFNLGMIEVRQRAKKMSRMSGHDLKEYMENTPAPVVIGPGGAFFIFDRHHEARALLEIGQDRMAAVVRADWQDLSEDEFWRRMKSHHWVWLRDKGEGPLGPGDLPKNVLRMTDDPYRSLARAAVKKGGCRKSTVPFAEFLWADFYRPRIPELTIESDYHKAVEEAISLAHAPSAAQLPGYIPAKN